MAVTMAVTVTLKLVPQAGVEPATFRLGGKRYYAKRSVQISVWGGYSACLAGVPWV
jgi:hypothetical protein